MRKILGKTAIPLILVLILTAFTTSVFADGTADFNGEGATNVWQYDTLNVTMYGYDAFGSVMKDLVPGDVKSVNVTLRNNAPDNVEFRFMVTPVTGQKAKALEPYFTGKTADDSLLDAVTIIVRHGATQLYNGTLRGVAAAGNADLYQASGISLGIVPAGYGGILNFELSVPRALGAAAMDKLCAIEWRFVATQYNDVVPPPPPPPGPGEGSGSGSDGAVGGDTNGDGSNDSGSNVGKDGDKGSSGGGGSNGGSGGSSGGGNTTNQTVTDETEPEVVGDTPLTELPDTQTPDSPAPVVEVDDGRNPRDSGTGEVAWALLNLLLTILALILMLWMLIRYSDARKRDESREEKEAHQDEYFDWRVNRKGMAWLVGVLMTVGAIILFILTEDMRLPMIWSDRYTIWHVLIVLIAVVFLLFSNKKREKAEPKDQ